MVAMSSLVPAVYSEVVKVSIKRAKTRMKRIKVSTVYCRLL